MYAVEVFPVGAFQCNCSIVVNTLTKDAWIVDPGDDGEDILARVARDSLNVRALWHTHAHLDHVGATKFLLESLSKSQIERGGKAPEVYLHPEDRWLYDNIKLQSQFLGLPPFQVPTTFDSIKNNQNYTDFAGAVAIHTPGHTPGSCCLHLTGSSEIFCPDDFVADRLNMSPPEILFSGDTLFRRSIGRTDLWGGDSALISKSIKQRLYSLNDETVVIPGHGPLTLIEIEKVKNAFVKI